MGLFDNLETTPEAPDEEVVIQPRSQTLEEKNLEPETTEEALFVARNTREQIEDEE